MVIIRADGNPTIGLGHIMRCLSLADAMKKNNEIVFVCADDSSKELIEKRGYKCVVLGSHYDCMDAEIDALKEYKVYTKSEAIIIDSYFVTDSYITNIREDRKVILFDDLCKKPYLADAIINYNIYADADMYNKLYTSSSNKTLTKEPAIKPYFILGPKFTPLREQFQNEDNAKTNIEEETKELLQTNQSATNDVGAKGKNILVLTGGGDPCHVALNIAKEVPESSTELKYTFVVGSASKDYEAIKEIEKNNSRIIRVLSNVSDMASLMKQSDLAISAAGSTLYELCACGIPTITYVFADNQIQAAKCFAEKEILINYGDIRNDKNFAKGLLEKANLLNEDFDKKARISAKMIGVTDGCGAKNLAREIEKFIST